MTSPVTPKNGGERRDARRVVEFSQQGRARHQQFGGELGRVGLLGVADRRGEEVAPLDDLPGSVLADLDVAAVMAERVGTGETPPVIGSLVVEMDLRILESASLRRIPRHLGRQLVVF